MDDKRRTRVLLEITWNPEITDHPAGWDFRTLLSGDPFTIQGSHEVRMMTFEDVDENDRPEQV